MVQRMWNECPADRIPTRPLLGAGNPHPMAPVRLLHQYHKPWKGTLPSVFFRVSIYLAWLHSPIFSRLRAFTRIILKPQSLEYLYFCLYNTPKLAFTFSANHTQNLCLKAKHPSRARRNRNMHWDHYRTGFPLLSEGQPHATSSPVCRAWRGVWQEAAFPKTPAAPPNSPASTSACI